MARMSADPKLFGIDLTQLQQVFRVGMVHLLSLPAMRWLSPSLWCKVVEIPAQSQPAVLRWAQVQGERIRWTEAPKNTLGPIRALLLPQDWVLERRLAVPALSSDAARAAASLQVQALSPFSEEDTLWSWRLLPVGTSGATAQLLICIASRQQVQTCIREHLGLFADAGKPINDIADLPELEVWAPGEGMPLVLQVLGSDRRRQLGRRHRIKLALIATLAGTLLAALAVTPSLQLRARALDALKQHNALRAETHALVEKRLMLQEHSQQLANLEESSSAQPDILLLLTLITKALPDEAALQRVQLEGQTLTLTGVANNAAQLVQLLEQQPGLADVRMPSATTRMRGSEKDNFSIVARVMPDALKKAFEQPKPEGEGGDKPASAADSAAPTPEKKPEPAK